MGEKQIKCAAEGREPGLWRGERESQRERERARDRETQRERSSQGITQGKHFPKAIDRENKRG